MSGASFGGGAAGVGGAGSRLPPGLFTAADPFGVSLSLGLDAYANHGYNAKLAAALNVVLANHSIGSSKAMWQDPVATPNCGHGRVKAYIDATMKAQSSAPYAPWPTGQKRITPILLGYADMYKIASGGDSDDPAAAIPRWKHAMRVILSRCVSAYFVEESGITFAGAGWQRSDAAGLTEDRQSGAHFQVNTSDTDGATALWQTPVSFQPGTVPTLVLLAEHGMSGTVTFDYRTYASDGTAGAWTDTGDTIDIAAVAPQLAGKVNTFCHRFTGLAPFTVHDLRATVHSPAGGRAFQVDCVQIETPLLHQVCVPFLGVSKPYSTALLFGANLADRDAKTDQMITEQHNLITEFAPVTGVPNPIRFVDVDGIISKNLAYFSPVESGITWAPTAGSGDGIHWNNDGHAAVYKGTYQAILDWWAETVDLFETGRSM